MECDSSYRGEASGIIFLGEDACLAVKGEAEAGRFVGRVRCVAPPPHVDQVTLVREHMHLAKQKPGGF